ncbi:MBL fold metallo-hydrolase [Hominifimenecus sp. rT4P-3]|uniref:MBL fold metallo-hydrolase n=1 Tax=Hominifimenecus sp. rT4P-3 TaxID=3242979 RepID=UPI003DA30A19
MELCCKHWKIAPDTYAIQCPGYLPGPGRLPGWGYVISYLIVGEEKALLQDTGYGNTDLRGYVKQLCDKPLIVVNSHVHPDHSGGNSQFDTVYVLEGEVESEKPVYFPQSGERARCQAVIDAGDYQFAFWKDGQVIDLGNREVEALRIEGHSKGSMALFDRKTRFLFSGDAILKRVLLFGDVPLSGYRAALVRTEERYDFADIYGSHWYEPLGKDYIGKMLDLIDSYDPKNTESAPWMEDKDMVMFCHGNAFEEKDFCAIGFPSDGWEMMKK